MKNIIEPGICFAMYIAEKRRKKKLINVIGQFEHQAPVARKVDKAMHRINHYPMDRVVCIVNTYPLVSDLSAG